jgi:predicted site-specific integrase-resolvase
VNRRTIRRWWYAGELPSPFYQGRTPFWTADAIRAHMRDAQARTNRT